MALIDGFSICILQHEAQKLPFLEKNPCQIGKKVVGSAQKFRVGRGALNTANFFLAL